MVIIKKERIIFSSIILILVIALIVQGVTLSTKSQGLLLGKTETTNAKAEKINRLDINKDGVVDITDLVALKRHLLAATAGDTENEWYIADQEIDVKTIPESNVEPVTEKTTCTDKYGNSYVIPKGFGLAEDSGETVPEGIVIEDVTHENTSGSQFVWVPVGKVYTDVARTEEYAKEITLGRYTFDDNGVPTLRQNADNYQETVTADSYFQELTNSTYGNTVTRSLQLFTQSAKTNGGYYIARFEAGVKGTTASNTNSTYTINGETFTKANPTPGYIVSKKGVGVWNQITQPNAAIVAKNMYDEDITSDLINSYAWDTAIVYIQNFGTEGNSISYSQTIGQSTTGNLSTTGTNILNATGLVDKQCNIYDMAGNTREWSTETSPNSDHPCVFRGGYYSNSINFTALRSYNSTTFSNYPVSFRPLLYL